jgi:hypothetical protein
VTAPGTACAREGCRHLYHWHSLYGDHECMGFPHGMSRENRAACTCPAYLAPTPTVDACGACGRTMEAHLLDKGAICGGFYAPLPRDPKAWEANDGLGQALVDARAERDRNEHRLRSLAEDMGLGPMDDRDLGDLFSQEMRPWVGQRVALGERIVPGSTRPGSVERMIEDSLRERIILAILAARDEEPAVTNYDVSYDSGMTESARIAGETP